jgi:hypothetical protein
MLDAEVRHEADDVVRKLHSRTGGAQRHLPG